MIRWPQSRTQAGWFDRLDLAAAGLDPDRASDRPQHRPASSLCRKPVPLGLRKRGVSSSSPFWKGALNEPHTGGRISKSALDVVRSLKPCCAEIAEADPILLQSSEMRARDREIACRSTPRHFSAPAFDHHPLQDDQTETRCTGGQVEVQWVQSQDYMQKVRALLPPTKPKNPRPGLIECGSSCANTERRRRLNSPKT
jgi:hypothetical protein